MPTTESNRSGDEWIFGMASFSRKECGGGGSVAGPVECAAARLKSETAFILDISWRSMKKAARRVKDPRAKLRLLALLSPKRGHSIRGISRKLKTAYSTERDWLLSMLG